MKSYLRLRASLLAAFCLFAFSVSAQVVEHTPRRFALTEVSSSHDGVWLATDLDVGTENVLLSMPTGGIVHGLPFYLGRVGSVVTLSSWALYPNGAIEIYEMTVTAPPKRPGKGLVTTKVKAGGLPERPVRSIGRRGKLVGDEPVMVQAISFGELKSLASQDP